MNTNPDAITVLCYGDSNTHGARPDTLKRFKADERWTGLLQEQLGDDYYVIEEGLGGRTTNLEYPDAPGRNGREYLHPCLQSHYPIDVVILMLGTNDLKVEFNRSAGEIGEAIEELLEDIKVLAAKADGTSPRIILVSPIHVKDEAGDNAHKKDAYRDSSVEKSRLLAGILQNAAQKHTVHFFDAATVAEAGEDGVHVNKAGHKALASALTELVFSV